MNWQRGEISTIESDQGYRITAIKQDEQWSYIAHGPVEQITQSGSGDSKRSFFRGNEYRARYARGQQVPPPFSFKTKSARHLVGGFHPQDHGTTAAALQAAKAACEADRANQFDNQLKTIIGGNDD